MKRVINIGNKKQACEQLKQYKEKHYESVDVEFTNVHLLKINDLVGFKLFSKNSLYVRSSTLWEVMQPVGMSGKHHYHGLEPETIVDALSSLINSFFIYESYSDRYAVLVYGNEDFPNIMVIIELNAGLSNDRNANVNKLVTIYPKSDLEKLVSHIDEKNILYSIKK